MACLLCPSDVPFCAPELDLTWAGRCFRGDRVPPAACSSRRSRPPHQVEASSAFFFSPTCLLLLFISKPFRTTETYFKECFEELMCTLCPGTPCTFPTRWDPCSSHVSRAVSPVQGHSLTSLQRGAPWAFPWHLQPRHVWYYRPVLSNASQFGFV